MRRRVVLVLALTLVLFTLAPTVLAGNGNHTASLQGRNEVPATDSKAAGEAIFKVRGEALSYKLIVANIEDVVAAHIHCAPEGFNGPVGVTLFGGGPTSQSGMLAQGAITEPNFGNACGWQDVADVIAALESGDTYVNVHTLGIPSGEIRGQIG